MTRELCPCGETRDDFGACWKCDRPRVACADEPVTFVNVRERMAGVCPAHGSWTSATAEGCPTCVMLTQLRYCAKHIRGGRAKPEGCAICGRIMANDAAYAESREDFGPTHDEDPPRRGRA